MSTIMNKWRKGENIRTNPTEPQFGDFTQVDDYHSAITEIRQAQENFLGLPSAIRDQFNNDPAQLLDFISDPGNLEDSVKLGLVVASDDQAGPPSPEPPATPEPTPPADPPAPEPTS